MPTVGRARQPRRTGSTTVDRIGTGASRAARSRRSSPRPRDERSIEEALQETLRFVPRLLRGRAKKMLFPEDG